MGTMGEVTDVVVIIARRISLLRKGALTPVDKLQSRGLFWHSRKLSVLLGAAIRLTRLTADYGAIAGVVLLGLGGGEVGVAGIRPVLLGDSIHHRADKVWVETRPSELVPVVPLALHGQVGVDAE